MGWLSNAPNGEQTTNLELQNHLEMGGCSIAILVLLDGKWKNDQIFQMASGMTHLARWKKQTNMFQTRRIRNLVQYLNSS